MISFEKLCGKLESLGYAPGHRVRMYGDEHQICSSPFQHNGAIAVRVTPVRSPHDEHIISLPLPIVQVASDTGAGKEVHLENS
jgi:hypothetical protein